ncbi:hypothetical protein B0J18DRAFT_277817 [Chaetomium sp. MPI-SDFR-AT-0129]|nr:hypothetical protein B0J18DRAFT_277817 [Chaetomium sp. MPI-SDFR-AT-0129]
MADGTLLDAPTCQNPWRNTPNGVTDNRPRAGCGCRHGRATHEAGKIPRDERVGCVWATIATTHLPSIDPVFEEQTIRTLTSSARTTRGPPLRAAVRGSLGEASPCQPRTAVVHFPAETDRHATSIPHWTTVKSPALVCSSVPTSGQHDQVVVPNPPFVSKKKNVVSLFLLSSAHFRLPTSEGQLRCTLTCWPASIAASSGWLKWQNAREGSAAKAANRSPLVSTARWNVLGRDGWVEIVPWGPFGKDSPQRSLATILLSAETTGIARLSMTAGN